MVRIQLIRNYVQYDLLEIRPHLIGVAGGKAKLGNQRNQLVSTTAQILIFRFDNQKWLPVICNMEIISLKTKEKKGISIMPLKSSTASLTTYGSEVIAIAYLFVVASFERRHRRHIEVNL